MSRSFAVIGDPIDHSMSPHIHSAAFRELGLDSSYIGYRIPKGELMQGIQGLKKIKIDGFNVTIPHKVEMMKYLDKTDQTCSLIGAVNTVTNQDGVLKGYNTDMDGFLEPLKKKKDSVLADAAVLLLGAGGAARAIVAGLAQEQAKSVTIANRTLQNAVNLAAFTKAINLDASPITIHEIADSDVGDYDVIINATSVGLKDEPSVISMRGLTAGTIVYDIVYMPINTDFIKRSKQNGATVIYGYEMLLGQAVRAFDIWHADMEGVKAPYNAMKRALLGGV